MTKMNRHWGTTLGEFLDAEGIREAPKAEAVMRVRAWQGYQQSGAGRGTGDAIDEKLQ